MFQVLCCRGQGSTEICDDFMQSAMIVEITRLRWPCYGILSSCYRTDVPTAMVYDGMV